MLGFFYFLNLIEQLSYLKGSKRSTCIKLCECDSSSHLLFTTEIYGDLCNCGIGINGRNPLRETASRPSIRSATSQKNIVCRKYLKHSTTKLYAEIMSAIKEKISTDPHASHFAPTGALKNTGESKKWAYQNDIIYSLER